MIYARRMDTDVHAEISAGERFAFGENWRDFLALIDEDRIVAAVASLKNMLGVDRLEGLSFIDMGSGSGLFSLAARRLGANVTSFDYDDSSVGCTAELRRRYFPEDESWRVLQGSVLDAPFLSELGRFEIVYSWGVLHHTGDMWSALENAARMVAPGGRLFISIYNDQGLASRAWTSIKRTYNRSGPTEKQALIAGVGAYFMARRITATAIRRRPGRDASRPVITGRERGRGMDRQRDLVDWVGGWPFEVAKPEEIFDFYHYRGFELERLKTCGGGLGCNEFVFRT